MSIDDQGEDMGLQLSAVRVPMLGNANDASANQRNGINDWRTNRANQ